MYDKEVLKLCYHTPPYKDPYLCTDVWGADDTGPCGHINLCTAHGLGLGYTHELYRLCLENSIQSTATCIASVPIFCVSYSWLLKLPYLSLGI